ncbi:RNA-binding cell elongation regulator Jag/EloR [Bacillus gobiensis]|uniref:RNA-binding cell elongation regulator Jag/EloR n=1 Tax=Bacillus gobiensis TaxID=1441095 RepID=UPI003D197B55
MKELTATGRTVAEAVDSALKKLDVKINDIEYEVIDEGKKGIFGLFGHKPAVVKVIEKPSPILAGKNYLEQIVNHLEIEAEITAFEKENVVSYEIKGNQTALLIGKRGQTLNALETLVQTAINRVSEKYLKVTVDAEGYREKRKNTLIQLAHRMSDQAMKQKKSIQLEPMPSAERKIIHKALSNDQRNIETYSEGEGRNRHVVISYKGKSGSNN